MDENGIINTYHVCSNVELGEKICDKGLSPFDSWFRTVSIFKASCGESNYTALNEDITRSNSCDPTWENPLAIKYRYCNTSITNHTVRQYGNGIIDPPYMQVLIWIMAVLALTGNVCVLIYSLISLKNNYQTITSEKKVHLILLTNLAFADFLMGVSLLCISAIAAVFTGLLGRMRFLLSMMPFCNLIGVLCFVSSQMSATIIIMISSSRLFSVVCPYKRINVRLFLILSAACWILWILFACFPLLNFENIRMAFDFVIMITCSRYKRAQGYSYHNIREILDEFLEQINMQCGASGKHRIWLSAFARGPNALSIAQHLQLFNQEYFLLSFYAQNHICMPQYFLDSNDPSQYLILFALCFNFAGFMYVLLAYVFIFYKVSGGKRAPRRARGAEAHGNQGAELREKENAAMQTKIQLIIASDFVSVVPMAILAFAHYMYFYNLQVRESCDEYLELTLTRSVLSTIMLPINSALNPFIYALSSLHRLRSGCRRLWRSSANTEIDDKRFPHSGSSRGCEIPQSL